MAGGDRNDQPQKENRWKRRKIAASAPSAYVSDLSSPFANRNPKASPSAGPSVSPSPGGTMSGYGAPLFMSGPSQTYPPVTGTVPGFDRVRGGTTPKYRQSDG